MKTAALTLAACIILSCTVRADDKATRLLGKWEMTRGEAKGSTAEFSKDGKIKVAINRGGKTNTREGTYKLTGDTLELTDKQGGKERTESFKVKTLTDKELVLVDKRNKEVAFKKLK